MPSPFEDDAAARELLEALRGPNGPRCPRCDAHSGEVFPIAGAKHNHRDGLYQCKPCRRQFTVTVSTPLERLRVPLSTWVRAAHAFSNEEPRPGKRRGDGKLSLSQIRFETGVAYRTVLRTRDIIKRAVKRYRGRKSTFGAWPRALMRHVRENSQKTIRASGILASSVPDRRETKAALGLTEVLLRLLMATPKRTTRKRRASQQKNLAAK
jgi:transposase-like protein